MTLRLNSGLTAHPHDKREGTARWDSTPYRGGGLARWADPTSGGQALTSDF